MVATRDVMMMMRNTSSDRRPPYSTRIRYWYGGTARRVYRNVPCPYSYGTRIGCCCDLPPAAMKAVLLQYDAAYTTYLIGMVFRRFAQTTGILYQFLTSDAGVGCTRTLEDAKPHCVDTY